MRQRWLRLLPIMMVTFIIAFMDRTNISFAITTMGKELALSSSVLGFASGVLFVGYGVSQTLGGWIADRGRGRPLVACLLVLWGVTEIAQAYVTSATELVAVRFFLGLFEGGIFPTFLLFVKNWFAPTERARANGVWQLCYPLAAIVSGPIAGTILTFGSWRDLFIVEGLFPIVWAGIWLWGVADTPQTAHWLRAADRAALVAHLARETPPVLEGSAVVSSFGEQMRRLPVVLFTIGVFFWNIGFLGFIIWLPSVIAQGRAQGHTLSPSTIGWFSAAPFAVAILAMQALTFWSDRTGDRRLTAAFAVAVSGLALLAGGLTFEINSLAANMVLLTVAGAMLYGSQPVLWSMPADMLPNSVAGTVMGAINGIGVLGGFLGPYIVGFVRNETGSFSAGLWVMGSCLLATSALVSQVRVRTPAALPLVAGGAPSR
jgi:sugar phosphate permease